MDQQSSYPLLRLQQHLIIDALALVRGQSEGLVVLDRVECIVEECVERTLQ